MESELTKACGNLDYSQENSDANTGTEKVFPQSVQSTIADSLFQYEHCSENIYLGDKKKRVNKEIRRMSCDCQYNPEEHNFTGCGEDCLNRLLMIECNSRCPCGEFCSNRKFQEGQKIKVEAFKTQCKGTGLKTLEDIPANQFVMEYCGEVMGYEEFESRVEMYDKENRRHYYFMTLKADEIIDATHRGNLSRFINHSCDPNCETQKWTVNGYLRIGFFSIKDIKAGSELTFDYKFQRYGKKAQVCYCESPNCRGYIGGEKHTPLKSVISGRASFSATNSPRRNRRGRLAEDFDDKTLELEITQLLGSEKGIKGDGEALKLSQFMVRAGTTAQRSLLLDTLMATDDQISLKSFVQYQGLSLLWSWMVDIGDDAQHLQKKIVQVLKHLPISNLNQIKDSKVLKVINKWARKPSVTGMGEEETSSATSDVDSQRLSPMELSDEASNREATISSSSTDSEFPAETKINKEEPSNVESNEASDNKLGTTCEADVFQDTTDKSVATVGKSNNVVTQPVVEAYEESEDDSTSTDSEDITDLAAELLGSWSHLKEVYRIPKKSTIVEKCEPESTSNVVDTPVTASQQVNEEQKILTIPAIEGDLFQEDEFLSKLGEREPVTSKSETQIIPTLVGGTPSDMVVDGGGSNKPSIHQRLQSMVTSPIIAASGMTAMTNVVGVNTSIVATTASKFPVWPGQGRKNRNVPYQAGVDGERWTTRVSTSTRFSQPSGYQIPQTVTTQQRPNVSNAPWQNQNTAPFPGGFQFPPGGNQRSSSGTTFPTSETTSSTYYQPGQTPQMDNNNMYGQQQAQPYSTQTPPQIHQPNMFTIPAFDSTKPPPNFIPKTSQFQTNTIQGQYQTNPPSYNQYSNIPTMYAANKDMHGYPGQPHQVPQQSSVEHIQVFGQQHVGNVNTGAPMISSTVSETLSHLRGSAGAVGTGTDPWPGNKSHDQELPPDWKKAYDGEGRAYYYHMVTRQTQWEPPMLVRSPPTPEVGYLGDELDSNIVMTNNIFSVKNKRQASMELVHPLHKKRHKIPSTPPGSPPNSPVGKSTTAAADTTDVRKGLYSPSALLHAKHLTPEQQKKREVFRMKLSAVVVNYLNPYHKVDCKVGRITTVDDFKFLARKLTHGVMVKELSRLKDENTLACNDSVKIKTKEYIRNYMQKFGAVYKSV